MKQICLSDRVVRTITYFQLYINYYYYVCYNLLALVDEHLVRKDENGYSLDHALVSDMNRSLIREMVETSEELQRIRRQKQLERENRRPHLDHPITSEDIETLLKNTFNKKYMNSKKKVETRELIDYKDIF